MRKWMILVGLIVVLCAGCQAPMPLIVGQRIQAEAIESYLVSAAKLANTWEQLYRLERRVHNDKSFRSDLDAGLIQAQKDSEGKPVPLSPEAVKEIATFCLEKYRDFDGKTEQAVGLMQAGTAKALKDLAVAQQYNEAVQKYMEAGIDRELFGQVQGLAVRLAETALKKGN
jgi:hypothetical protein